MKSTGKAFRIGSQADERILCAQMPDTLTLLMPAFNAAKTIEESIRSVISQTYRDWILLVLDDGSTDETLRICERLAEEDARIRPVAVSHIGLCGVLNLGLRVSRSRLIARIDSDDLAYPARLERQIAFLKENPDVKVLGTWGDMINDAGRSVQKLRTGPGSREEYRQERQDRVPLSLLHASVMADRDTLLAYGGYLEEDYPAEDVWLWTRIAQDHPVLALPEDLTGYRINAKGISKSNFRKQLLQSGRLEHWLRQGERLDPESFEKLHTAGLWRRARAHHDYLYRYCFRVGSGFFVNERRGRGAVYLAACAVLNPAVFLKRIWKRLTVPGDLSRPAAPRSGYPQSNPASL